MNADRNKLADLKIRFIAPPSNRALGTVLPIVLLFPPHNPKDPLALAGQERLAIRYPLEDLGAAVRMMTTFVETLNGRGRVVQLDGRLEFQPSEEIRKQVDEAIIAFSERTGAQESAEDSGERDSSERDEL